MEGNSTQSPTGIGGKPSGLAARRKGPPPLPGLKNLPEPESREQIAANTLKRFTTVEIANKTISVDPQDVEVVQQLGKGAYGIVEHVRHMPSGVEMAVKRTAISQEQKRFLMDMDVPVKAVDCPYIVKFYGALFWEGDLWIFMEIMDSSLDKFYRSAYEKAKRSLPCSPEATTITTINTSSLLENSNSNFSNPHIAIPEYVLGKIAYCVIKALSCLHGIDIIHRDVKPSNILINRQGEVKLCDFGIAGPLINSVARTIEVGCKPYMAPERINPPPNNPGYDIRSDIWSLGITMLEMAIGEFPYPLSATNFFNLLKRVCHGEPPRLPSGRYSADFDHFINQCLQKDYTKRPYYTDLLKDPFITSNCDKDISEYVSQVLSG